MKGIMHKQDLTFLAAIAILTFVSGYFIGHEDGEYNSNKASEASVSLCKQQVIGQSSHEYYMARSEGYSEGWHDGKEFQKRKGVTSN